MGITNKKAPSLATIVFLGCLAGIGCGRRGDTMAVVNGEPISTAEYIKYLENKPEVSVVTENGTATLQVDGTLGFQAVRDLISNQIKLQLAKEQGVSPTSSEVDHELEIHKKMDPNFVPDLLAKGLTIEMIKKSVTLDLAQEKLLTRGINVTAAEVDNYIGTHKSEFMEPPKAILSIIFIKDASSEAKVDSELGSGQSFTSVALRYSESANARTYNGKLADPKLGPRPLSTFPQQIQDAISGVGEQSSTGWIPITGGLAKIYVDRRIAARPVVMDSTKKEMLRRAIAKTKGSKVHDLNKMMTDKLLNSQVDVLQPEYSAQWKQQFDDFKSQK